MSGRKGEYRLIKATYPLADPQTRDGSVVHLLECGHVRTGFASRVVKGRKGLWCRVCTAAAEARAKAPRKGNGHAPADLEALIAREVNRRLNEALEQMTAPTQRSIPGNTIVLPEPEEPYNQ